MEKSIDKRVIRVKWLINSRSELVFKGKNIIVDEETVFSTSKTENHS